MSLFQQAVLYYYRYSKVELDKMQIMLQFPFITISLKYSLALYYIETYIHTYVCTCSCINLPKDNKIFSCGHNVIIVIIIVIPPEYKIIGVNNKT